MLSIWEEESFLDYDVIIIGAGIIGLSSAITLLESAPSLRVAVFERGLFPSGASSRNAGFACFGSLTEILHDFAIQGMDATLSIIESRIKGLEKLKKRLGEQAIDFQKVGGFELLFEGQLSALERLDEVNAVLRNSLLGQNAFSKTIRKSEEFGFHESVKAVVENPHEGHIHSGKLMRALREKASLLGITIFTMAQVTEINHCNKLEHSKNNVEIKVTTNTQDTIRFTARSCIVATNSFTKNLLPTIEISPGRGTIILTKELEKLPFRGTFHFDEGFYYFRDCGSRILFGGGRNLDFHNETTHDLSINPLISEKLQTLLHEVIAPHSDIEIDRMWSGIMGFSENKLPLVQEVLPFVFTAFGCNGMGVALGSSIAEEVACSVLEAM